MRTNVAVAHRYKLVPTDPNVTIPALRNLKPGERIVYHTGCLDSDRSDHDVNLVANTAFALAHSGEIHIVQRRVAPPDGGREERTYRPRGRAYGRGFRYAAVTGNGSGFQYIAIGAK